ncbi:MAG: molybdenum cofactor guanylyltransferase MobA [Rhodospirillaceae bacterium]
MPEIVAGVILAGGRSRRMGGDNKALLEIGGQNLLARTVAAARPQVGALVLSANSEQVAAACPDLPAVADSVPDFAGPLAGILAGFEWAGEHVPGCRLLAGFAVDAPLFPPDLVARLAAALDQGAEMACAVSGGRRHPVFGLWPVALAGELRRAVVEQGVRRIEAWTGRYRTAMVEWPVTPLDPFHNVNTPEDLALLRALLAEGIII